MRDWIATMTEENKQAIWDSLWEIVHQETTKRGRCTCGRDVYVPIPDGAARTRAVELLMNQGFGRPKETVEQTTHIDITHDVEHISDTDLGVIVGGRARSTA